MFAEVNRNLPELAVFVSMLGESPAVLKFAMDNRYIAFYGIMVCKINFLLILWKRWI